MQDFVLGLIEVEMVKSSCPTVWPASVKFYVLFMTFLLTLHLLSTMSTLSEEVQETPRCTALYRPTLLAALPVMRHLNHSGQGGWLTFGSINCFVIWKLLSPWSRRWVSLYQDTSRPEECFFFFPPLLKKLCFKWKYFPRSSSAGLWLNGISVSDRGRWHSEI